MALKYYAQVDFELFLNTKFRDLSSNDIRFAYLAAYCSKSSNYVGLFQYPTEIWSYEANLKPLEVSAAIAELEGAGLVEYDADFQTLRLVGWFHSLNAPDNANQMKGHIKKFHGLASCAPELLCRSIAEFTVSSFNQSLNWEDNSPDHRKAHEAFRNFLKALHFRYGDDFTTILLEEINRAGKATYNPIQACFHMLPRNGLEVVQPLRKGFETVSKQEKRIEESKGKEKKENVSLRYTGEDGEGPTSQTIQSQLAKQAKQAKW